MTNYELNANGQAVSVTEQPVREPQMQMQPSPILLYMQQQRMQMAQLFGSDRTLQLPHPFALPMLPEEMKPRFDVGGGR